MIPDKPRSCFQGPTGGGVEDERGNAMVIAAEHASLKFVSKKAPLPIVIIDHIDPPTPN